MKFHHRRANGIEEGESYYVSMTDMMVGVLFIFIIMLSYFALQFRVTTASLSEVTASATQDAGRMDSVTATIQLDRQNHVVCLPGSAFGDAARHCFAYTSNPASQQASASSASAASTSAMADADQAEVVAAISADLTSEPVKATSDKGGLSFKADELFQPGTATLSPAGQATVAKAALSLAKQLPCYGDGARPADNCDNSSKLQMVGVGANASVDSSTPEGRAAASLTVQRSAAFYAALVAAQPSLRDLKGASGTSMVHVNTGVTETPGHTTPAIISVRLQMAH